MPRHVTKTSFKKGDCVGNKNLNYKHGIVIDKIIELNKNGMVSKKIAEQFGVSRKCIFSRLNGIRLINWRYIHKYPLSENTKKKIGLANKSKRKGRTWEEIFGIEKAKELKKIVSERSKKLFPYGFSKSERARKQISEKAKQRYKDKNYLRRILTFIGQNKQEKFIEDLLVGMGYEYKFVGDGQFVLGGRCPDFMNVNGQKKLIEFFGTYWHKEEDSQSRINHFRQFGFETLVIWDKELKDIPKLKSRIKEFHCA